MFATTKSAILCSLLLLTGAGYNKAWSQKLQATGLTTEYLTNPVGLDSPQPRLGWKISSATRDTRQVQYEIKVSSESGSTAAPGKTYWESGPVKSDQQTQVSYTGPELTSASRYYWQVRIKDNHGNTSAWSALSFWQMGILKPADWTARWISTFANDTAIGPSPYFRKTFTSARSVRSATAFITAHGMYEAYINGARIGRDFFTPGWTSYHKHLLYQTYDVTSLVKSGANTLGFVLGDGWYRGTMAFDGKHSYYGNQLSGLVQLEIVYSDGTRQVVQSDASWKYARGPILYSDIYNGETYDARKELNGWSANGYKDADWKPVIEVPAGTEKLEASISPMARKHEEFKPVNIITTPKGEVVLDFGQNLVGWVKVNLKGQAGTEIKISHAEVLDKAGNFYTENLRTARQQVTYTLKGGAGETFEPHFTYQGFRYIKLEGYLGTPVASDFTAIAIYSDMKPTGTFTSSDTRLNQLQHNIQWGQKGNFVDVPTDCPQRNERLGWTGDAQVFSRTATFNMDVAGFFTKWMKDVAADQLPNGSVPFVIPNVLGDGSAGSTGWADVATIIPWNLYLAYGDKQVLSNQYPSMKAWVDFMTGKSTGHLWNTGFHFGDWLFYHPDDDNDGRAAITDKYLIAQCFYAHSTQLLIDAARVLGNDADVASYTSLLAEIKKAFVTEYMTPNGRLVSGSQTAYVLALNFDMIPEALRQQAADRLAAGVRDYDNHLTTGFLGTPYLCHVLTRFGYNDIAYTLLLQDTYPSWLYPVKMGATTIWERWDGLKPDGTFQTPGMNSFNHYSYGAIGDWMYRVMAGLDTRESGPGYKQISIAPHPGGGLTFASATLETLYGKAVSSWTLQGKTLVMNVTVPAGTSAEVILPDAATATVTETGRPLTKATGISAVAAEGKDLKLTAGSGTYQFKYVR